LFAVILRLPISTTFSLVKKVIAVKMVNANPRITIMIPIFFIIFFIKILLKDKRCPK
jgi:phosphate/sulfate permease